MLFVASEMAPFAKTGGLADVMAALPAYLIARATTSASSCRSTTRSTRARRRSRRSCDFERAARPAPLHVRRSSASASAPTVYFVHCPALYARGRLYTSDADEHRRFLALSLRRAAHLPAARVRARRRPLPRLAGGAAAADCSRRCSRGTALFARTRTLLTIHNLMYQGSFPVARRARYEPRRGRAPVPSGSAAAPARSTSCSRASSTPTASARSARPTRARSRRAELGARARRLPARAVVDRGRHPQRRRLRRVVARARPATSRIATARAISPARSATSSSC